MGTRHRAALEAMQKEQDTIDHGSIDFVQVEMWQRLSRLYSNSDIEIGIWVGLEPVDELVFLAQEHARTIVELSWIDWTSNFTAVFDWPGAVEEENAEDANSVFRGFEHYMKVVKFPTTLALREQWGVSSFAEAFEQARRSQPRNRVD